MKKQASFAADLINNYGTNTDKQTRRENAGGNMFYDGRECRSSTGDPEELNALIEAAAA